MKFGVAYAFHFLTFLAIVYSVLGYVASNVNPTKTALTAASNVAAALPPVPIKRTRMVPSGPVLRYFTTDRSEFGAPVNCFPSIDTCTPTSFLPSPEDHALIRYLDSAQWWIWIFVAGYTLFSLVEPVKRCPSSGGADKDELEITVHANAKGSSLLLLVVVWYIQALSLGFCLTLCLHRLSTVVPICIHFLPLVISITRFIDPTTLILHDIAVLDYFGRVTLKWDDCVAVSQALARVVTHAISPHTWDFIRVIIVFAIAYYLGPRLLPPFPYDTPATEDPASKIPAETVENVRGAPFNRVDASTLSTRGPNLSGGQDYFAANIVNFVTSVLFQWKGVENEPKVSRRHSECIRDILSRLSFIAPLASTSIIDNDTDTDCEDDTLLDSPASTNSSFSSLSSESTSASDLQEQSGQLLLTVEGNGDELDEVTEPEPNVPDKDVELAEKDAEIVLLKGTISGLQKALAAKTIDTTTAEAARDNALKSTAQAKTKLQEMKTLFNRQTVEVNGLKSELRRAEAELIPLRYLQVNQAQGMQLQVKHKMELEKLRHDLELYYRDVARENMNIKREYDTLAIELADLEHRWRFFSSAYDEVNQVAEGADARIQAIEAEHKKSKEDYNSVVTELEHRILLLENELATTKGRLEKSETYAEQKTQKNYDLLDEVRKLKAEIARMKEEADLRERSITVFEHRRRLV